MAEVTEMTNVSPTMPPPNGTEPPKRGRGRPRKETKKPVEPPADDDLGEEITGNEDFWLRLSNYTLDEWNYLTAYLFRVRPRIDRKANGKDSNIQAYSVPFTRDEIMHEHGSGVYRIDLCALEPAGSKSHRIAREVFSIINYKYPPVVPPGDWVEEKGNEFWKWGANMPAATANGGGYPPGFNIADMMDKADNRALRMVEIMTPKKDAEEQSLLLKLIDVATARNNAPAPPPPDTKQTDRLFEMLLEDRKQAREELALLREKIFAAPPQKSIIEQFVEIQPQIKSLVDGFATRTGKTDIWAEIAKEGVSQIPDVVGLIRDMVNKKAPEPQQNGMGNHQPAAIAAATSEPPAKPIADMTEDEKRAFVDHLWKKWGGRLLQISTRLVEEFTIQDNGYSFRDWYVEMYGKLNWADLKREVDPELMANMYLAHEQLRKALSPPVRLVVFLREFATDFGQEDDTPLNEKLAAVGKSATVERTQPTEDENPGEAKP